MVQRWILKVFLVQAFLALNALAGSADEVRGYTPRENASSPLWCGNVQQIAGTREDKKEILCRAVPPGKSSNQGNTSDTVICIKPLPAGMPAAQANMLCDRAYGQLLRGFAATRALAVCRDTHKVRCEKVNCKTDCNLTVTVTRDRGVQYDPADPDCPGKDPIAVLFGWTASCSQSNIGFDCDCRCPPPASGLN